MRDPLILDRYQPIEVKGEGASGKVEICWDTRIQRRVAIKRMPISGARDGSGVPGLAEARTGAMLSRPSIVSVYDFDVTDSEALIIMEAIEGPTLSQIIHDTPNGAFDLNIAAAIIVAVGDALEFAHENQVLHLDIKPDNILVNRNGATKVSDFGVSELGDAQGFRKASGGTIGYMPPEQMSGHRLDERADEFALAAVTYEILTGIRPFTAKNLTGSTRRIQQFDLIPPSTLRNDLDPRIDNVLFAALSPNSEDRYPSVEAFLNALLPYLGNPAKGARRLREIVQVDDEEIIEPEPEKERRSVFDRLAPWLAPAMSRTVAAALCWWLATSALLNIPVLTIEISMLIALLPALGAVVKPPYGAFIALAVNGVSLFFNSPPHYLLGIVALMVTMGWTILFSRKGIADTNCALLVSPLSVLGVTPLAPMIAGFCLPPVRALGASVVQAVLMLSAGSHTGPELLFGDMTDASTWVMIIGWILATVAMSALCCRESRILSVVGAIACAAVLLIAQNVAIAVSAGAFAGTSTTWMTTTLISCVAMCVVGFFGMPLRHKGED